MQTNWQQLAVSFIYSHVSQNGCFSTRSALMFKLVLLRILGTRAGDEPIPYSVRVLGYGGMLRFSQQATVSPSTGDCWYNRAGVYVCHHVQYVVTAVYTPWDSTYQSSAFSLPRQAPHGCAEGRAKKNGWILLKNTDTKCCVSLHISFWTQNYLRVIITYNYFYSQVLEVSCKAALLSTHTLSRPTGGLLVNESIYFNWWAKLYCATWLIKQQYQVWWIKWYTFLFLIYLGEV